MRSIQCTCPKVKKNCAIIIFSNLKIHVYKVWYVYMHVTQFAIRGIKVNKWFKYFKQK